MLLVPEIEKVFILVPRTGSGSLYREVLRVYPRAMLLYRHMEADGCPRGYDRWERVGVVRHPLTRLWSLYRFLKNFGGGAQVQGGAASLDAQRIRTQVDKTFEEWLLTNDQPFTTPQSLNGDGAYWPVLSRINPTPENKLSQASYLRPDLGTKIFKFEDLAEIAPSWGLTLRDRHNTTEKLPVPDLSPKGYAHLTKFCRWDLDQGCKFI